MKYSKVLIVCMLIASTTQLLSATQDTSASQPSDFIETLFSTNGMDAIRTQLLPLLGNTTRPLEPKAIQQAFTKKLEQIVAPESHELSKLESEQFYIQPLLAFIHDILEPLNIAPHLIRTADGSCLFHILARASYATTEDAKILSTRYKKYAQQIPEHSWQDNTGKTPLDYILKRPCAANSIPFISALQELQPSAQSIKSNNTIILAQSRRITACQRATCAIIPAVGIVALILIILLR